MAQSNNLHILSTSPINFSDTSYINAVIPGLFFYLIAVTTGFDSELRGQQSKCYQENRGDVP